MNFKILTLFYFKQKFMNYFLQYTIWENSLYTYSIALIIFICVYIGTFIFRKIILKKLQLLATKTQSKRDDRIARNLSSISKLFYIAVCVYIPLQYITLNPIFDRIIKIWFLIIIFWEVSNVLIKIIKYILDESLHEKRTGRKDNTKIHLFHIISKIIIYVTWWLLLLSNLWVEITPLLASVWVMWVAIAFALQKILWDIFASFSIFLDRPFEIGDFIIIWEDSWNVKDIGLKSTRIQTLQWQELIIPNAEITGIRINNYGKMKKRRVIFTIGIVYQTDPEIIEKIPSLIQNIIEKTANTEFDRAHFIEFWKSELVFEIVYYINTNDFKIYRDTHQTINLEIMKTFKKQKIDFAYPTQSIYIENTK